MSNPNWQCPRCGFDNIGDNQFCSNCGFENKPDNNSPKTEKESPKVTSFEEAAKKVEFMIGEDQQNDTSNQSINQVPKNTSSFSKKNTEGETHVEIETDSPADNKEKKPTEVPIDQPLNLSKQNLYDNHRETSEDAANNSPAINHDDESEDLGFRRGPNVKSSFVKSKKDNFEDTKDKLSDNSENREEINKKSQTEELSQQPISQQNNYQESFESTSTHNNLQINQSTPNSDSYLNNETHVDLSQEPPQEKKNGAGKAIAFLVAFLVILILLTCGAWFYFFNYKPKQESRAYLVVQTKNFNSTIEAINALTTETLEDESSDVMDYEKILTETEEEIIKTEEALNNVRLSKENLTQSPEQVAEIEMRLKEFYKDSDEVLQEYLMLAKYSKEFGTMVMEMRNAIESLRSTFTNPTDKEQKMNLTKETKKEVERLVSSLDQVTPPEDLEEIHEKMKVSFTTLSLLLQDTESYLDEYEADDPELVQQLSTNPNAQKMESSFVEMLSLYKIYMEKLHEDFINLRKDANGIRTIMVTKKTELELETEVSQIDNW